MRALVVGERMNLSTYRPPWWPDVGCDKYWKFMRRLGAFNEDPARGKLRSIGLDLDADDVCSVNLLPPDPQSIPWDCNLASQVASAWLPRINSEFDVVFACGVKVAAAFNVVGNPASAWYGFPVALGQGSDFTFVMMPHPSGLNLWWNDESKVKKLRRMVQECL